MYIYTIRVYTYVEFPTVIDFCEVPPMEAGPHFSIPELKRVSRFFPVQDLYDDLELAVQGCSIFETGTRGHPYDSKCFSVDSFMNGFDLSL